MNVDLIDHSASDLKCVNAARVSYNTHHDELTDADIKLINAMVREGHGSVFEHGSFTFRVTCPLVVKSQWQKHRVHSYNEMSARYVEMPKQFYVPKPRQQFGKAMEYTYMAMDPGDAEEVEGLISEHYEDCYKLYEYLLDKGLAKEAARYVLPGGLETQFYWTCNPRALMHFLSLRNAPDAMEEIRTLAKDAEISFSLIMPYTHKAFIDNGRKAP